MQTSVTFKNLDSSENLKSYVRNKLNRLDKFLDNLAEANVVLLVEKFRHIAEINIIGDRLTITGKEETGDMYSAIDIVMDKLEKQIKKNKQKIKKRRVGSRAISKGIMDEDINPGYDEVEKQVRVKNIEYKPMDVEEAIMQMSLVKYNFLVFTNARTEKINVLYQRNDGHYGLIQPSN